MTPLTIDHILRDLCDDAFNEIRDLNSVESSVSKAKQAIVEAVEGLIAEVEKVNDSNGRYNACAELRAAIKEWQA